MQQTGAVLAHVDSTLPYPNAVYPNLVRTPLPDAPASGRTRHGVQVQQTGGVLAHVDSTLPHPNAVFPIAHSTP